MVVGLHAESSLTGSFFGFPMTINVLPRINLHGILFSLIYSNMNNVVFMFESTSSRGFSKDFECDVFPAK